MYSVGFYDVTETSIGDMFKQLETKRIPCIGELIKINDSMYTVKSILTNYDRNENIHIFVSKLGKS